eukprot:scaffold327_cov257-Pinguiococcus_pyrenoidosus.AAC.32
MPLGAPPISDLESAARKTDALTRPRYPAACRMKSPGTNCEVSYLAEREESSARSLRLVVHKADRTCPGSSGKRAKEGSCSSRTAAARECGWQSASYSEVDPSCPPATRVSEHDSTCCSQVSWDAPSGKRSLRKWLDHEWDREELRRTAPSTLVFGGDSGRGAGPSGKGSPRLRAIPGARPPQETRRSSLIAEKPWHLHKTRAKKLVSYLATHQRRPKGSAVDDRRQPVAPFRVSRRRVGGDHKRVASAGTISPTCVHPAGVFRHREVFVLRQHLLHPDRRIHDHGIDIGVENEVVKLQSLLDHQNLACAGEET